MLLRTVLGLLLGGAALSGLITCLVAFYAVVRLAKRNPSPIYIMSSANILIDIISLTVHVGYLIPSILLESYLFPGGRSDPIVVFLGGIFLFCWYYGSVAQILVAVNRLVTICFPHRQVFTKPNSLVMVLALVPLAGFTTYISQYGLPCCQFSYDHVYLSYSYTPVGDTMNYSNYYIDLWLNSATSFICTVCYILIVAFVRKMNTQAGLDRDALYNRRQKEYAYSLQFCAISVFYLLAWVFFRVFPIVIGNRGANWFVLISLADVINSSANAAVYLYSNKEVRNIVKGVYSGHSVHEGSMARQAQSHSSTNGRNYRIQDLTTGTTSKQ